MEDKENKLSKEGTEGEWQLIGEKMGVRESEHGKWNFVGGWQNQCDQTVYGNTDKIGSREERGENGRVTEVPVSI